LPFTGVLFWLAVKRRGAHDARIARPKTVILILISGFLAISLVVVYW
jgi:hypothetical protein